ncbi:MAG: threonine synthase [Planctomycetes bacterium]|nr:threonine synthase [Planctomycetota bacterium]
MNRIMSAPAEAAFQRCINPACAATYGVAEILTACKACGELLDVAYDWNRQTVPQKLTAFERKYATRRYPLHFSGVWRFKELLNFVSDDKVMTIGEGQTLLRPEGECARYCGLPENTVFLQYEGLNPSGSFKDNGMSAGFSHAKLVGAHKMACASTGNTSASLAAYAASTRSLPADQRMEALVFVGSGRIALGKLSQSLDYGAKTIQIAGYFDDAMKRVREVGKALGIYLVNSVNPFRLEGQKTIMYRILEALNWEVPDWIVVPGGNLGNSSAFAKAFQELKELGLIPRIPRLAVVNASGANTLHRIYNELGVRWNGGKYDRAAIETFYAQMDAEKRDANTIASAIEINRPVNLSKCLRALEWMNGVVLEATDQEILDAKAVIGRGGLGCEPASAASVAGLKQLVEKKIVSKGERIACVITGHELKAANATVAYHSLHGEDLVHELGKYGVRENKLANYPVQVKNDLNEIIKAIGDAGHGSWDA